MSAHSKGLWEKLEGIKSLKKEMLVRLAVMRHVKDKDADIELLVNLHRTDLDLEEAYAKVRQCATGTPEEEVCLGRVRELEDQRFKLQSLLNGDRVTEYTAISPK